MSRIRVVPTISALILTFAVLFGGYQVYKNYELVKPLESQLLAIHAVQSAHVLTTGQNPEVVVKLGKVSDLQATYRSIYADVTATLGTPVGIELQDHRTPALSQLYETMGQILYQGIARGDYMTMTESMQSFAAKAHVTCRITMNGQDIFVQLSKGNAYLYDIVPYAGKLTGVNAQ